MTDEYDVLLNSLSSTPAKAPQARPSVDYRQLYNQVGQKYGVDPDLLYNQAKHESVDFNPKFVYGPGRSPKGAAGIAQFMPDTARQYGLRVGKGQDDRFNPQKAADAHARLMRDLISQYGDTQLALAAYNSGTNKTPDQARRAMQRIPETRNYVQKIAPQGDAYDQLLNEQGQSPKQAPKADPYDSLLDSISGQTPPPQSQNRVNPPPLSATSPPQPSSRQQSVPSITDALKQVTEQTNRIMAPVVGAPTEDAGNAEPVQLEPGGKGLESPVKARLRQQIRARTPAPIVTPWSEGPRTKDEDRIAAQTEAEYGRYLRANEPEMLDIRREYGRMGAPARTVAQPLVRVGAGILKTVGGVTSGLGIAPNRLSEWANKRAQLAEEGTLNAPLDVNDQEIAKGVPEKIVQGVADLGLGIGEIVLLKKATRLPFNQLMALESALKSSDQPIAERAKAATEAYALGTALDQHLGRAASAALFGAPTAIQGAGQVARGEASPLDVAIQTGIQAGAGAVLGGKRGQLEPTVETRTQVPDIDATLAVRERVRPTFLRDDSGQPVARVLNPDEVAQGAKPEIRPIHQADTQARDEAGRFTEAKSIVTEPVTEPVKPVEQGARKGVIELNEPIPDDALRAINRTFNQMVGPDIYSELPKNPTAQDVIETLANVGLSDQIMQEAIPKLRKLGYSRIGDVQITDEGLKFALKELPPAPVEQRVKALAAPTPETKPSDADNTEGEKVFRAIADVMKSMEREPRDPFTGMTASEKRIQELENAGRTPESISQDFFQKTYPRLSESDRARFDEYRRSYGDTDVRPDPSTVLTNWPLLFEMERANEIIKGGKSALTQPKGLLAAAPKPETKGEPSAVTEPSLETTTPTQAPEEVRPPPSITSARKEMMASDRGTLDLPELPPAERKGWQRSLDEAQPDRANVLADEVLEKPRPLTDAETASLVVRAQQVKNRHAEVLGEIGNAADPAELAQKRSELNSLESEFDKLTTATKKSGTEKGRTLAAQKLTINQDFDLISMKNRLKAAKGDVLTPQETAKVEELHARLQKAESDLAAANEKLAHRDLQRQIDRVIRQRQRTQSRKSLDDEFAQLRAQFAQARAETRNVQASGLAGLDPEGKLTKLIGQMARNRVQAGTVEAKALVREVYEAVKEHVEGVTERDVRDAISGYGLAGKGDQRSDAAKRLGQIRTELRNLSKEEDVAAGRRLSARDTTRRKQLAKEEANLLRRMKAGDFEKPERQRPRYNRETYEAEKRVKDLRADFEKMRYRATRSTMGKLSDTAIEVGNVPKTMLSMADLSATLRQGGIGYVQHPVLSTRAARDMLTAFTEHGFANVENAIKSSPEFENAKRAGVEFTGLDRDNPHLNRREEGYLGGGAIDTLSQGKYNPLKAVKAVKDFSERTFVSFLDSQRMRIFEHQAQALRDMGLTGKELDRALKSQAGYINIITGRGSLGTEGNKVAPAMNLAMFSPRLVASRFQFINKMFNPVAWARMPKGARKLQMVDNLKYLAGMGAVLGLAKASGVVSVNTDPDADDSEFLKLKIGNTRYDVLSGLQQPMRFMIRMGRAIKGGEFYSGDPKGKIVVDFTRSKASPEVGLLWDYLEGKNRLSGKRFEALKDTRNALIPLPAQDFYDAIKDDGALRGSIEALPTILGVGVQTYKGAAEKPITEAEKLARRKIIQRMPDTARSQEEIDKDAKRSELRARARAGEDVSSEVTKLNVTEGQAKTILEARNKTRLQEDFNRLGIKDAIDVYRAASESERQQLREIMERKATLVDKLPNESDRNEARRWLGSFGITASRARRAKSAEVSP